METKEQLVESIKHWIMIDEEIKTLRSAIKDRQITKKSLTNNLVEVMKTNEIDAFDINNGKLIYSKQKTKQTLSKKLLLSSLNKLFDDPKEATKIAEYVLQSRAEHIHEIIRRKISK